MSEALAWAGVDPGDAAFLAEQDSRARAARKSEREALRVALRDERERGAGAGRAPTPPLTLTLPL
jgi:hypothetical protein